MDSWMLILWIVWALLLFGGLLFGRLDEDRTRRMLTWTRMGSSLVLVVAAWMWFLDNSDPYGVLIAVGMTLGFIGDLFMADLIPIPHFEHVLGGMSAFGLGHIAYIVGVVWMTQQSGYDLHWLALLIWLGIGVIGWYVVVFRGQQATVLHYAALPYALLLATTAGTATGLALQIPAFGPLALGAALFLLSDLILAAQLFNGVRFYLISDVVWLTYGPGQMLIVYASALAAI
ncbi:MAG: lysoplasmalogenase [Anaerolineae bacterium]|nr:lysoplasmalogenase [Anaerolineae bacterium]